MTTLHYAPPENWLNDPNGLVHHQGRYHLYYQYNPDGHGHANMSWGHASSSDLVGWEHHPVALPCTDEEEIYSGSIVIDRDGVSGYGSSGSPALLAFYTSLNRATRIQAQAVAYSLDGGFTWTPHAGNPVLDRGSYHFRDPKVIRYAGPAGEYWVMVAVEALDRGVLFYRSDDLLSWSYLSEYGPAGPTGGVWECPDLFPLAVDGDPSDVRWVLLISMNPGGVAGGSGTEYVVGSFDGVTFTPDVARAVVESPWPNLSRAELERYDWVDYGRDCYAGVTFAGLPDTERTLIAWMSNWDYARDFPYDPAAPRRGRMTLARRLSLVTVDGRPQLRQEPIGPPVAPVLEIDDLVVDGRLPLPVEVGEQARLDLRISVADAAGFEVGLGPDSETAIVLRYMSDTGRLQLDRRAGADGYPRLFPSVESMPIRGGDAIELTLWIDQNCIEIFADGGTRAFTNLTAVQPGPVAWIAPIGSAVVVEHLGIAEPIGASVSIES